MGVGDAVVADNVLGADDVDVVGAGGADGDSGAESAVGGGGGAVSAGCCG